MASSKEYLDFILEQLSDLDGVSYRAMMGEYVIYYSQKVVGGIYDDRFLIKPTKSALKLLGELGIELPYDIPYEGAKQMLVADADNSELCCKLIAAVAKDIPLKKSKK